MLAPPQKKIWLDTKFFVKISLLLNEDFLIKSEMCLVLKGVVVCVLLLACSSQQLWTRVFSFSEFR